MINLDYEIAMALKEGMDVVTIARLIGLTEEEIEDFIKEWK